MSRTMSSVAINLDGTEALLLPERAVFLGSARALVVADGLDDHTAARGFADTLNKFAAAQQPATGSRIPGVLTGNRLPSQTCPFHHRFGNTHMKKQTIRDSVTLG